MYLRQSRVPLQKINLILDDRQDTCPSQSYPRRRETLCDSILWSLQVAVYTNMTDKRRYLRSFYWIRRRMIPKLNLKEKPVRIQMSRNLTQTLFPTCAFRENAPLSRGNRKWHLPKCVDWHFLPCGVISSRSKVHWYRYRVRSLGGIKVANNHLDVDPGREWLQINDQESNR